MTSTKDMSTRISDPPVQFLLAVIRAEWAAYQADSDPHQFKSRLMVEAAVLERIYAATPKPRGPRQWWRNNPIEKEPHELRHTPRD